MEDAEGDPAAPPAGRVSKTAAPHVSGASANGQAETTVLPVLGLIFVWKNLGFAMILFLAGTY